MKVAVRPCLFVFLFFLSAVAAQLASTADDAFAHSRATSFSYWRHFDDRIEGKIVYPWVELQQAFPQLRARTAEDAFADEEVRRELRTFFSARATVKGGGCEPADWSLPRLEGRSAVLQMRTACSSEPEGLSLPLAFAEAPSHVHLVRYEKEGAVLKGALSGAETFWPVGHSQGEALPDGFLAFLESGFSHILAGLDHLIFLLGLLLLAPSLRTLAGLATGFTLSHSVALAVAVLGLAKPDTATVEALIGFTVAFTGIEVFLAMSRHDAAFRRRVRLGYLGLALLTVALVGAGVFALDFAAVAGTVLFTVCFLWLAGSHPGWRWLLVFFFGFVHGFGFAGPLTELELSRTNFAEALFGFNLGVEAGQLAFLAVAWPVLKAVSRLPYREPIQAALAAVVLAAGLQWFLLRALG